VIEYLLIGELIKKFEKFSLKINNIK